MSQQKIHKDFETMQGQGAVARWNPDNPNTTKLRVWEENSFELFLAHLRAKFGPAYLCRPDGEALALVDPDGVPRGYVLNQLEQGSNGHETTSH